MQDDNDCPNRAMINDDFLETHGANAVAISPDLNHILHLWEKVTNATTLTQMRQIMIKEWNIIPRPIKGHLH